MNNERLVIWGSSQPMWFPYSCNAARVQWLTSGLLFLAIAGCATPVQLAPRNGAVPADIDLSGRWTLAGESRSVVERRAKDVSVHVFLETGSLLRVSQTEHGLFASFDRARVEEFRFGENRIVNVGPVEAQRVSGWDGRRYVVETLDDAGAILREVFWLGNDGNRLNRRITIVHRENTLLDVEQRFTRKTG